MTVSERTCSVEDCAAATDEFRAERGITAPLRRIDPSTGAVFWQVSRS